MTDRSVADAVADFALGDAMALAAVAHGLKHAGVLDLTVVAAYARTMRAELVHDRPIAAEVLGAFLNGLGTEGGSDA